jgi:NTP pyrophosphatase (non-canonical NTP hydrolase)
MHVQDPSATSGLTMVTKDIASTGNLIRDYEKFVTGLFKTQVDNPEWNMAHAALGIGGESGEVVDLIKKTFANGKELDIDKLTKELGDLMFYQFALMKLTGITIDQVLDANIEKLRARYPNGYSDLAAQQRKDEASNGTN